MTLIFANPTSSRFSEHGMGLSNVMKKGMIAMMRSRISWEAKIEGKWWRIRKYEWLFAIGTILAVIFFLANENIVESSHTPTVEEVKASVAGWTQEIENPRTGIKEKRIHGPGGHLEILTEGRSIQGNWRVTRDALLCQMTGGSQSCFRLVKVGNNIHFRTRNGSPGRTAFPIRK